MKRKSSLVARVAWGAVLSASVAALVAAIFTSIFAAYLLQRAEDRRITDVVGVLATELRSGARNEAAIEHAVREESFETNHTGVVFAVFADSGRMIVGDRRIAFVGTARCETQSARNLRACSVAIGPDLIAVAASGHTDSTGGFILAAFAAALVSALLAWIASLPLSQRIVAPLSRLRAHIAAMNLATQTKLDLGAPENIVEVDELKETIAQLLSRVAEALAMANRFASDAAHELRTPLTTIRGELELLSEQRELGEQNGQSVDRVLGTVGRLATLVERLLILATPQSTEASLVETVSLRDLLEDTVEELSSEDRNRLQFRSTVEANVRGDSVLLRTMLSNVVANALKFGMQVSIELASTAQECTVVVQDDGPGVAVSDRERVFEAFFRSAQSRASGVTGHGLGLAIVAHIARMHGGSARFVECAKGARIELRLPGS